MSKRLLSPTSTVNTEDKRRRNDSLEIDDITPSQIDNMEKEPTLSELKVLIDSVITQLKSTAKSDDLLNLASKRDIKEIDDRVTAQNTEISQIRTQMKEIQNNVNSLQMTVDGQLAASYAREGRSMGRDPNREPGTITSNMAAPSANRIQTNDSRRRNLVIEGLKGDTDMEMKASFIDITSAIGMKVYGDEIENVLRMPRRDVKNLTPGPVLLTLSRIVLHDNILRRKGDLAKYPEFKQIFINADESIEVRRAKSFLRKASYNAKRLGDVVIFRHNQVTINGTTYTTQDVNKLPDKYLKVPDTDEADKSDQAIAMDVPTENEASKDGQTPKEGLTRRGERMKVTRKGLCFSGPSAYLSNMAYVEVKARDKIFVSNEQRYQWEKAIKHEDEELAREIKETRDSYEVKNAGGLITASAEWLNGAPDFMDVMIVDKFEQNPDLLERLIDTYPLELIEASIDDEWGGGAPYQSKIYDSDDPLPGNNIFGKKLTKYRNQKIEKMRKT